MPTSRVDHLSRAGLFVTAALFLLLALPAGSTAHDASAEARKRCATGSEAALIGGKRACLREGQRCDRVFDRQYHRYDFHCHSGRLTRTANPEPTDFFFSKVDVGGFRLAITCRGTGSPTVILESGGGNASDAWWFVEPLVGNITRVCSYDRAGLGRSDARRPGDPMPVAKIVEELNTLLGAAGISPPCVLGGWSIGGFFNRLYTKRYPSEVLGLVAVDGTPIGLPPDDPFLNPPGFPPSDLIGSPPDPHWYYYAAAGAELAAAPDLGSRPLVVLTHGRPVGLPDDVEALWLKWQKQVALLSTSSMLVRADRAGHGIQIDAPELTAAAFRQVIQAVRRNAPLPVCAATRLPDLRGTCLDPTSPSLGG
jgi:pimeloyl-ACP methyl ester carboxylesterase